MEVGQDRGVMLCGNRINVNQEIGGTEIRKRTEAVRGYGGGNRNVWE